MKSESERGHDGGVERGVVHLGIGVHEVGGDERDDGEGRVEKVNVRQVRLRLYRACPSKAHMCLCAIDIQLDRCI